MSRAEFVESGEFGILRAYPGGVQLYGQGLHSGDVFLIKSGAVKLVCVDPNGRETIIGLRWPGSFVGAESIIAKQPNPASIVTLMPSIMEQIAKDEFLNRLRSDTKLTMRLLESHSQEILEQAGDLGSLAVDSARMRFVRLVRKLSRSLDTVCLPDGRLNLPMKKKDFAAILGIDPAHFSRMLNDLRAEGLISSAKQWIVIRKIDPFMDGDEWV